MKRIKIVLGFVLVLASAVLFARAQTKDVKGSAMGKVEKTPSLHQVAHYPTMME